MVIDKGDDGEKGVNTTTTTTTTTTTREFGAIALQIPHYAMQGHARFQYTAML